MKTALLLLSALACAISFSSCSMTGCPDLVEGPYEKTFRKRVGGYDTVRTERVIDAKSGLVEVTETQVPRYEMRRRKAYKLCPKCVRYYCIKKGCCGSSTEAARKMATAQASGSPHLGLIPTMKQIVP